MTDWYGGLTDRARFNLNGMIAQMLLTSEDLVRKDYESILSGAPDSLLIMVTNRFNDLNNDIKDVICSMITVLPDSLQEHVHLMMMRHINTSVDPYEDFQSCPNVKKVLDDIITGIGEDDSGCVI